MLMALLAGALLLRREGRLRYAGRGGSGTLAGGSGLRYAGQGFGARVCRAHTRPRLQVEEARRGGPRSGRGAAGLPQPGVLRGGLRGGGEGRPGSGVRDLPAAGLPDSALPQLPAPKSDQRSSSRSYFLNPLFGEAEAEA